LPKNWNDAPAMSAGTRAAVGASPTTWMDVASTEKSTIVAPLPTMSARAKRASRSTSLSRAAIPTAYIVRSLTVREANPAGIVGAPRFAS
jgi:hypothetical protein